MANSPLGVIKIPVDGSWDIENLRDLSESLSETYGLFYPLVAAEEDTGSWCASTMIACACTDAAPHTGRPDHLWSTAINT